MEETPRERAACSRSRTVDSSIGAVQTLIARSYGVRPQRTTTTTISGDTARVRLNCFKADFFCVCMLHATNTCILPSRFFIQSPKLVTYDKMEHSTIYIVVKTFLTNVKK